MPKTLKQWRDSAKHNPTSTTVTTIFPKPKSSLIILLQFHWIQFLMLFFQYFCFTQQPPMFLYVLLTIMSAKLSKYIEDLLCRDCIEHLA